MTKALIIKTSSMGDVIHTLPAITDACRARPDLRFDWVVEENFAEIPAWHPKVENVIPVAIRRWRKNPWQAYRSGQWQQFYRRLREQNYDFVIDAQGLIKSAFLAPLAKGPSYGLDKNSAREPMASYCYGHKISVNKSQHAVTKLRELFSKIFQYPMPTYAAHYGVDRQQFTQQLSTNRLLFLHGTTWPTKHWPETYWQQLATLATEENFIVQLPWGNEEELQRAKRIASQNPKVEILPAMNLMQLAGVIASSKFVVAVDTGLGHLTAALGVPSLSIYGPTNPDLTGSIGVNQFHLAAQFQCAPCLQKICTFQGDSSVKPACFATITPSQVWQRTLHLLSCEVA